MQKGGADYPQGQGNYTTHFILKAKQRVGLCLRVSAVQNYNVYVTPAIADTYTCQLYNQEQMTKSAKGVKTKAITIQMFWVVPEARLILV